MIVDGCVYICNKHPTSSLNINLYHEEVTPVPWTYPQDWRPQMYDTYVAYVTDAYKVPYADYPDYEEKK